MNRNSLILNTISSNKILFRKITSLLSQSYNLESYKFKNSKQKVKDKYNLYTSSLYVFENLIIEFNVYKVGSFELFEVNLTCLKELTLFTKVFKNKKNIKEHLKTFLRLLNNLDNVDLKTITTLSFGLIKVEYLKGNGIKFIKDQIKKDSKFEELLFKIESFKKHYSNLGDATINYVKPNNVVGSIGEKENDYFNTLFHNSLKNEQLSFEKKVSYIISKKLLGMDAKSSKKIKDLMFLDLFNKRYVTD